MEPGEVVERVKLDPKVALVLAFALGGACGLVIGFTLAQFVQGPDTLPGDMAYAEIGSDQLDHTHDEAFSEPQ